MALEGLGMRGDKCSKGMLRTPAVMAVIAVMISLLPLLVACSSEGSEDQSAGSRQTGEGKQIGNAGDGTQSAHSSGSQAALVPIAHLNSTAENVSMEELSKTRGLAVGRGYRDDAAGLLGSSRFEGFDSGEAGIKALSVDGEALLDAERSGDYPLRPEGATVPDPEELRRVVVGGDIVLDRGQNYMVIQKGMGIDFPLDG